MLEDLVGVVAEIISLKVGTNVIESDTASDLVLVSEFADQDALNAYNSHPEHQKALDFGKAVIAERRAVDFEV
mgnify:CR=1 FL=1